jgi:hypothetical protein
MGTLYVKELFGLLRSLALEQQEVGAAMGSNKTQISLWANGKRPLPKRMTLPFLEYVARAMQTSREAASAKHHEPHTSSLLGPPSPAEQLDLTLIAHLRRWELECYDRTGNLWRDHERHRNTIAFFPIDIHKLSPDEFTRYMEAVRGLHRTGRLLAHLLERTDLTEGRSLGLPDPAGISPLEYLWRIVREYQGAQGQEEDEEASG